MLNPIEIEDQIVIPEPPYTSWTTEPELGLHGPRGINLSIEKTGVRLKCYQSLVIGLGHCSGCAPQSKSGWLGSSIRIVHPDEISLDTPLGQILQ